MPGMFGTELARTLSASRPGLQTLYVSGYTDDAIAQRGVLDPQVAFLAKPFTARALAHKVRQVLDAE
jgi:FixJ family two-component response regulator